MLTTYFLTPGGLSPSPLSIEPDWLYEEEDEMFRLLCHSGKFVGAFLQRANYFENLYTLK